MKLKNFLIGGVFAFVFLLAGHNVYALDFCYSKTTVAQGWKYGQDEHWHLVPVGEKNIFYVGEKVQFFAQVGPISQNHKWKMELFRNGELYQEFSNVLVEVNDCYGWNYSNFVPYVSTLPVGVYRVDYYLDEGNGFEKLASNDFVVVAPEQKFVFDHAVTAKNWTHGESDEYWNLQAIEETSEFNVGDTVYLLVQIRDVYVDHRYRVELYKDGDLLWDYETAWQNVGAGWKYGNFYPFYKNAQGGHFTFKTYIDTGDGFQNLAETSFTVAGGGTPYTFSHLYVSTGWKHGEGEEYWNLQPTKFCDDDCAMFKQGETIYALAQVKNIYVSHSWRAELYRGDNLMWTYDTSWQDVGGGWTYGNFYPFYENAQPGDYTFKVYLNTGQGYQFLAEKSFSVCGDYDDYSLDYISVARGWEHGSDDYWNLQAVGAGDTFTQGDDVYLVAQIKNVYKDHRWRIELYNLNTKIWTYDTAWNNVGAGWNYSSFYPVYHNIGRGSYTYKVYLDTGNGFQELGVRAFSVN